LEFCGSGQFDENDRHLTVVAIHRQFFFERRITNTFQGVCKIRENEANLVVLLGIRKLNSFYLLGGELCPRSPLNGPAARPQYMLAPTTCVHSTFLTRQSLLGTSSPSNSFDDFRQNTHGRTRPQMQCQSP